MNKTLIIAGIILVLGVAGYMLAQATPNQPAATTPTPQTTMETPNPTPSQPETETGQTIVEIAANNPNFSTLVTAVTEAGLADTLSSEGPFTVFAPTNQAFEQLPEGTLEALLQDQDRLQAVLTYHVVPGEVASEEATNLHSATTVQGQDVEITTQNGVVFINDAEVLQTDIQASNGVIHVIDTVLLPQ